ncbi:MAG: 23S rRNA (adenine(2503)-C(2))-methyltransferase RlmN, partial [bacterium]
MALMPRTPRVGRLPFSSASSSSAAERRESAGSPAVKPPLTPVALRAWLRAEGVPAFRATQILSWVYQRGVESFDAMTDVGRPLRTALAEAFTVPGLAPSEIARSSDNTRKLLFTLERGRAIESVIIPDPRRLTACISSQAGCAMGCDFCATAKLGLQRHLTAAEIAGQLVAVRDALEGDERLSNVVFM